MQKNLNILILDEELFASITISDVFKSIDQNVTSVRSGKSLIHLSENKYDLIFICCFPPYLTCKENIDIINEYFKSKIILVAWEWFEITDYEIKKIGIDEIVYVPRDIMNLRDIAQRFIQKDKKQLSLPEKPYILVVDDDKSVLRSIKDILETQFDVKAISSPNEAISFLENEKFHILITDLIMEEIHGLELIQAARIIQPDILSIVITGYANQDVAIRSLKEGVYDFLEKPLKFDLVIQSVKRAFKTIKAEMENKVLINQLKTLNIELKNEVEDHKKTVKKLARETTLARCSQIAKNEFIRNISHEIHTPLNGVIGVIDYLMSKDEYLNDYKLMETAKNSANDFLALLDQIISFSNIEIGKINVEKNIFSIHDVIDKIINIYKLIAKEKKITVKANISKQVPDKLEGDSSKLHLILFNLVGNAIKFTKKGKVEIRVVKDDNTKPDITKLCFSIIDTGIGIPEEKQKKIFEPFTQGDGKTTRNYQGIGLGLTLSTRLIKLLCGEIKLKSIPDKGSTFYFTLNFNTA